MYLHRVRCKRRAYLPLDLFENLNDLRIPYNFEIYYCGGVIKKEKNYYIATDTPRKYNFILG